jgi:hypothetical protein
MHLSTLKSENWVRTSGFAIASLGLGLSLGFTLIGGGLAVLCGTIALAQIRASNGRLAGTRFAVAGIVSGVLMAFVTSLVLLKWQSLDARALMNEHDWSSKLRYDGGDLLRGNGFTIRKPNRRFGVANRDYMRDNNLDGLVLISPPDHALIHVRPRFDHKTVDTLEQNVAQQLRWLAKVDWCADEIGNRKRNIKTPKGYNATELQVNGSAIDVEARGVILLVEIKGNCYELWALGPKINREDVHVELRRTLDSFEGLK